jgi:hypothetical protein
MQTESKIHIKYEKQFLATLKTAKLDTENARSFSLMAVMTVIPL